MTKADYVTLATNVGQINPSALVGLPMSTHILHGNAMALAHISGYPKWPLISATSYGAGHVVHFGHENVLKDADFSTNLGKLVLNAAAWAPGGSGGTASRRLLAGAGKVRVGATDSSWTDGVVARLVAQAPEQFTGAGTVAYASISTGALDLLVLNGQDTAIPANQGFIRSFVAKGGGLLIGSQTHAGWSGSLADHPTNQLLVPMGIIVHTDKFTMRSDHTVNMDASNPPPQLINANVALNCLDNTCRGATNASCYWTSTTDISTAKERAVIAAGFIPSWFPYWDELKLATQRTGFDASKPACTALAAMLDARPKPPPPPPAPPPPPVAAWGGCPDGNSVLAKINQYRKLHGAEPLAWSGNITASAYYWSANCDFKYSDNSNYGENLYLGTTLKTCSAAVDKWYSEALLYGQASSSSANFTQLVWKSTKDVGCGLANCGAMGAIVTCRFDPPGNVADQYASNVEPQCTTSTQCLTSTKPICSTTTKTCTRCTKQDECKANAKSTNKPFCVTSEAANKGTCVQCLSSSDCPTDSKPVCTANVCEACTSSQSCVNPKKPYCIAGACSACTASSQCTDPAKPICTAGLCASCTSSSQCPNPSMPICELTKATTKGSCRACLASSDCNFNPAKPVCSSGTCVPCTSSAQCTGDPKKPICNASTGICGACANSTSCDFDPKRPICTAGSCVSCTSSLQCTNPSKPSCDTKKSDTKGSCMPCSSNSECSFDVKRPVCSSGSCVACTASAECTNDAKKPICELTKAATKGSCVACTASSQCNFDPRRPLCVGGACTPCTSSVQCLDTLKPICELTATETKGSCTACSTSLQCSARNSKTPVCSVSGSCVPCTASTQCNTDALKPVCELVKAATKGTCVACTASSQCSDPAKPVCVTKAGPKKGSCVAIGRRAVGYTSPPAPAGQQVLQLLPPPPLPRELLPEPELQVPDVEFEMRDETLPLVTPTPVFSTQLEGSGEPFWPPPPPLPPHIADRPQAGGE